MVTNPARSMVPPGLPWSDGYYWDMEPRGGAVRRDIIVLGASAGGVEALRTVVAGLPPDLDAAVLVVLHLPAYGSSALPHILSRAGTLLARHAVSGEPLTAGRVYVAPPDHHLLLDSGRVLLSRGPTENGHRPAIDVLFRSAARSAGRRVMGAVLSGVLDDGTAGLAAIAGQGGTTLVQDPEDALYRDMPANALRHVAVDHVATAADLGPLLARLSAEDVDGEPHRHPIPALLRMEADLAKMDDSAMNDGERPGTPSGLSCPDCNGVLFEIRDGPLTRYRCRVGHAWSAESLFGQQSQQLEGALWMALRVLEEKAALARMLRDRAAFREHEITARRFDVQGAEATQAASLIRSMLESHVGLHEDTQAEAQT
jgi:two-component system chemotaxis response regulator CheB